MQGLSLTSVSILGTTVPERAADTVLRPAFQGTSFDEHATSRGGGHYQRTTMSDRQAL